MEGEEANQMWEDLEVLQLIALKEDMEQEFLQNGKKQGMKFFVVLFPFASECFFVHVYSVPVGMLVSTNIFPTCSISDVSSS